MTSAAASASSGGARVPALLSIGEVLATLRPDFPDVTISKLRFLEAEGLVEPVRTAAGYRKYSAYDVARLRYVLTAQRDHYLPLRVIRDHLATLDENDAPGWPGLAAVGPGADAATERRSEPRLSRAELADRAGLNDEELTSLEQHGLIAPGAGGGYDADALVIATAARRLAEYGLEGRHLRAYRAAADREAGLFAQLVAPLARQGSAAGRARADDTVRELAALTQQLQSALVRARLRETLGQ